VSSTLDTRSGQQGVPHAATRRFPTCRAAVTLLPLLKPMKNSVRERRTALGWSQADLGERLDVSRQTVNAIETGKYDPSLPLAFKIARLFALSIESLFTPED
jgi:putative transcriptional regulator